MIDNYDSFVYNLAQHLGELGAKLAIFRNDAITLKAAERIHPDRIIISPGPGNPENEEACGNVIPIIRHLCKRIPTLGVCLGHQMIVHAFEGKITKAKRLMHGKTSLIKHDSKTIFRGTPNPFEATRYHSLVADPTSLPESLEASAYSLDDSEIMGVRHTGYPIEGVQFHPESILTGEGKKILKNFLDGAEGF